MSGALFRSTSEALRYAYHYAGQQGARSAMAIELSRSGESSGKGLHGLDGAAQAGMILAELERLTPLARAALRARYGPMAHSCPMCGGDGLDTGWRSAVNQLAQHATAAMDGHGHMGLRLAIVGDYYGRAINLSAEAERYGIPDRTARDHRQRIAAALKAEERSAHQAADERLRASGMVGEQ